MDTASTLPVVNIGPNAPTKGSLRACRDESPHVSINGADLDRSIFATDDRIKNYNVDQALSAMVEANGRDVGKGALDLLIVDGLDSADAEGV